jgi:hypothetical protein
MTELVINKPCKHGDLACGSGYWDCGKCAYEHRRAAWNNLTPQQRAYDNMVDPLGAYHTDFSVEDRGCSCHISPPCNYCINKGEDTQ